MKLDYTITEKPKRMQIDTRTGLSMQATLENAMSARQPQPTNAGTPPPTSDGFGRSV